MLQTDVGVLSDEIYEQLTYGDARPTCFATLRPGLKDRTITISGVSKTLRHDRMADRLERGPGPGLQVHGRPPEPGDEQPLLGQPVGGPGGDHRPAGFGRCDEGPVCPAPRLCPGADREAARRDLHAAGRGLLRLHECLEPLRPDAGRPEGRRFDLVLHGGPGSAKVALVMGSAFGAEGYARMSFATDLATIEKGFDALERFLAS